jgi:hypothetical protein
MNSNLVDVTIIIDRSGSMQSCRIEAENGVNPIEDVPSYRLVPRSMTALMDAIGSTIEETGKRLANMSKKDRPGLVIIAILTDGLENASYKYKASQIKEMITHQEGVYGWEFTFLGANQNAFLEAAKIGIEEHKTANFAQKKVNKAFQATSQNVTRMRGQQFRGERIISEYTDAERREMS